MFSRHSCICWKDAVRSQYAKTKVFLNLCLHKQISNQNKDRHKENTEKRNRLKYCVKNCIKLSHVILHQTESVLSMKYTSWTPV